MEKTHTYQFFFRVSHISLFFVECIGLYIACSRWFIWNMSLSLEQKQLGHISYIFIFRLFLHSFVCLFLIEIYHNDILFTAPFHRVRLLNRFFFCTNGVFFSVQTESFFPYKRRFFFVKTEVFFRADRVYFSIRRETLFLIHCCTLYSVQLCIHN